MLQLGAELNEQNMDQITALLTSLTGNVP